MDPINPYAVMRNTATLEAYRAYTRKATQPLFALGILPFCLTPVALALSRRALHASPATWTWTLVVVLLSWGLGGLCLGVGIWRMARYRRENPIPDEWRLVPRTTSPPVPARRSPPPPQG